MTVCEDCGAESLAARLPSGRHIELSWTWTWVAEHDPWPDGRLFTAIHRPVEHHPEPYYARPVTALMDRVAGESSGPFHREHVCRMEGGEQHRA